MQRLAELVPRLHLIRFHGVLAPNAGLRAAVVPGPAQKPGVPADEHMHGAPALGVIKVVVVALSTYASHRFLASPHTGDSHTLWFAGTVAAREFLGESVRYTIDAPCGPLLPDRPHLAGEPEYAPGQAVHLGIVPAQLRVLRT